MYKLNPLEKLTLAAVTTMAIACGSPEKKVDNYHKFEPMKHSISIQNPRGETGEYNVTIQPYDAARDLDVPNLRWAVDIVAANKDAAPQRIWVDGKQPPSADAAFVFDKGRIVYKVGGECGWGIDEDKDESCKSTQKDFASEAVREVIYQTLKANGKMK